MKKIIAVCSLDNEFFKRNDVFLSLDLPVEYFVEPLGIIQLIEQGDTVLMIIAESDYFLKSYKDVFKKIKKISQYTVNILLLNKIDNSLLLKLINNNNVFRVIKRPFKINEIIRFIDEAKKFYEVENNFRNDQLEQENFRILFDTVPCSISCISDDLKYLDVNKYLIKFFKKKKSDFIGKKVGFLESKNLSGSPFVEFIDSFFKKDKMIESKEIPISLNNSEKSFFYIVASKHSNKKKAYIVGLDITRIKNIEDELRVNHNNLALIFQSLSDGIVVLDRENNVSLMNILTLELLNLRPDKSCINIKELFVNCEVNIDELVLKINSDNEKLYSDGIEVVVKKKFPIYIRITKSSLPHVAHDKIQTILILRNITKEKEVEKMKNEFISNLSHELRTPMNAIIGISTMLSVKKSGNLTDHQLDGLNIIHESGNRLLTLINDLLDLSKIEAGKMELILGQVSIVKLCDTFKRIVSSLIDKKKIKFKVVVFKQVPGCIITDSNKLYQVLNNLLGNAVKFTNTGRITLKIRVNKEKIIFKIIDTGIGISQHELPFVFDRFRQVDGSISKIHEGTGIGLSLSKKIIELLGGEIFIQSKIGEGTIVTFNIPLFIDYSERCEIYKEFDSDLSEAIKPGKKIKILVVDDEKSSRETLKVILEPEFEVVLAENSRQALNFLQFFKPDIILMDIVMSELNGFELIKIIRYNNLNKIPVIAVTAKAMDTDKEKILKNGFDGYIPKPVDPKKLCDKIYGLIKNNGVRI